MFAVSDGYSFVTIVSILCSFFSLLFSFFNKRNLSSMVKLDEAIDKSYRRTKEAKEAKVDHGDGVAAETDHGDGVAAETELTVVVPDNAKKDTGELRI